ncbi:MAG: carotenoid oxygenase family protein [Pseudomonadales bacterium]
MTTPFPNHPQLRGNFAPLRMECDLDDAIVRGELPRDLDVTYYRNGPDPQFPPQGGHHWFGGDGMVHMFRIRDGRVSYRNRWVRTVKWKLEHAAHRALMNYFNPMVNDPSVAGIEEDGLANTNIVWHGNRLLALEEGHAPFELDPRTLESLGAWKFDGRLEGPMTAHPKMDPKTGEMLFFGYMVDGPFGAGMSYQVVDRNGVLTRSERFQAPYASMVHDFITTDEHVIFPIFPLTGSLERAMKGEPPFAWEPDKPTSIGVMRRDGSVEDIRWFETDPCYVFHPMNAYTDGNRVVCHVMQFEEAPLFPHADGSAPDPEKANARLCEWVIDLGDNSRGVQRRYLDDITGEFPRLDERFAGLGYRHGYYGASTIRNGGQGFNAIAHHDFATGSRSLYELPSGDATGEPVFVPRAPDAAEGDGYLLSVVYRGSENRSDLAVFDAGAVDRGPIATVELPHRVPFGFHGNWKYND